MPETVFFQDGKMEFFTQMDRDCCLAFDLKIKLESSLVIRTKLNDIVKERRKDYEKYGKEAWLDERNKQVKMATLDK